MTDSPPHLPPDLVLEVRRTITELRGSHLAATAWPVVAGDLGRLAAALERADVDAASAALLPVSRATFEGKVRGRLANAGQPAALVVGTKPTSALPLVGAVSAALLVGIGYLLGGWGVAAATSLFALFILVVALAGTRTTNDRIAQRRRALEPNREPTEPAPLVVVDVVARIEDMLVSS